MSNNKVYNLRIIKYKDKTTLYILTSYERYETIYGNSWINNIKNILRTNDKYELKIKLNLLGLYFPYLTMENFDFTKKSMYNLNVNIIKIFELKSYYEN